MTNEELAKSIVDFGELLKEINIYKSIDLNESLFSSLTLEQQRYCLLGFFITGIKDEVNKVIYDNQHIQISDDLTLINQINGCLSKELDAIFCNFTEAQQRFCLETFILAVIKDGVDEFTKNLEEMKRISFIFSISSVVKTSENA